jgi:hypothetical protein
MISPMKKFKYSGQINDVDKMHGVGRSLDFTSGNIYEGEFVNGVMEGFGRLIYGNSKIHKYYVGMFETGFRDG